VVVQMPVATLSASAPRVCSPRSSHLIDSFHMLTWRSIEPMVVAMTDTAGEGRDFIAGLPDAGWQAARVWGRDGWDLGDWPLAVIAVRAVPHTGKVEVCEYVEGDWMITTWPDVDTATGHVDGLAQVWWDRTGRGPADPADGFGPNRDWLV
jgi:hypothetical protein